jgi:L-fuconolactonase
MTVERIDAHHHLWDPAQRDYEWLAGEALAPIRHRYDAANLREQTRANGISRTILVQTVPDVTETVEFLATADANRDLIAGVVGWVDLTNPGIKDTLASLRAEQGGDLLIAIRHQAQDEPDPEWLAREEVQAGIQAVAEAGLAYDLLIMPHQLPSAIRTVQKIPEGKFILDHAAKPPIKSATQTPWADLIEKLAEQPNVACKLSGLVTESDWKRWSATEIQPYADVVLTNFGPTRTMFGSDWPVCELATNYEGVVKLATDLCAQLTDQEKTAIFSTTATKWYQLQP